MKYSPQKPQTATNVFETETETETEPQTAQNASSRKEKDKSRGKKRPRFKLGYSLICVCLVAIVAGANVAFTYFNMAYTTVSITFAEIAKGCNPDGSPFDIYEMLNDEVLEKACQKLDNKVTPEILREHLSVTGITTDGSFNAIWQNVLDGNDTYSYFPSKYNISYSIVSDAIKDGGIVASVQAFFRHFTLPPTEQILSCVAQSYKEYYIERYVVIDSVFEADWTKIGALDYYNRVEEMDNMLNRVGRYLEKRYDGNTKYLSDSGVSFGDLSAEVARLRTNDLGDYKAFVIQNGVTADKDTLLKQFRYVAKESAEKTARSRGEYNIMLEGISIYDPLVTKVVFIPALDADNVFYMNRTKIGIDYLVEKADTANLKGDETQNTVDYCNYLIGQFSSVGGNQKWMRETAEQKYAAVKEKIDALLAKAAAVNQEYIENVSYETVSLSHVGREVGLIYVVVEVVKVTVIFSALLYLWWLICLGFKKAKAGKGEKTYAAS